MICPECGSPYYCFDGKCFVCPDCGYWTYIKQVFKILNNRR